MMSNSSDDSNQAARQWLSALMDGDAATAQVDAVFALWPGHSQVRERWHAYHLIGDVLRSNELASSAQRDEAFLLALRAKLKHEPVPVALQPIPVRQRMSWQMVSAAAAAGCIAVAGVVLLTRPGGLPDAAQFVGPNLNRDAQAEVTVANGKLIRDAQLDRYLAAHRRVSNGVSVVVPGAIVRSVDNIAIDDR